MCSWRIIIQLVLFALFNFRGTYCRKNCTMPRQNEACFKLGIAIKTWRRDVNTSGTLTLLLLFICLHLYVSFARIKWSDMQVYTCYLTGFLHWILAKLEKRGLTIWTDREGAVTIYELARRIPKSRVVSLIFVLNIFFTWGGGILVTSGEINVLRCFLSRYNSSIFSSFRVWEISMKKF